MHHLFRLHRALSCLIRKATYIERADAIFATGLLHLTLLFAYTSHTDRRKRFRQLNMLPHTYDYHHFLAPCTKLQFNLHLAQRSYHQHGHFYTIGSTTIGIPHREHNRKAKLKQLQNNTPISTELSVRNCRPIYHHPTLLHILTLDNLLSPPHLRIFLDANMNSIFFPT